MGLSHAVILLTYFVALFLRKKLHNREWQRWIHESRKCHVALLLQPYTFLMLVFMIEYAFLVISFMELLGKYSFLEPSTFTLPDCVRDSGAEYSVPGVLRVLALVSPLFIGLTWVVTMVHWAWHLPRHRGFDEDLRWYPSYSHDLAMQVVALPLVYGIFSLDSVLEMLRLLTGQLYTLEPGTSESCSKEWSRLVLQTDQTYQSNTQLADLYEAWALRCFGMLCFVLVGRQINREVPTVKYILNTIKRHLEAYASVGSEDRSILADVKILNEPRKQLFEPLQQTSRIGVRVFVWTYALKSMYLLVLSFLAHLDLQLCGANGKFQPACSLLPYLDGACFLASALAIYNIVVFEQNLSSILSEGQFRPFAKFLGVKVMVSLAFIQSFALSVLGGWLWDLSKEQINLCYSSLLCCEVFPLSLLLFVAWRPLRGDWHNGDLHQQHTPSSGPLLTCSGQLADEAILDGDEFQRSRELVATLGPRPAFPEELTGIIELRGQVEAREAKALEDVINGLSRTIRAQYKPATLCRAMARNT